MVRKRKANTAKTNLYPQYSLFLSMPCYPRKLYFFSPHIHIGLHTSPFIFLILLTLAFLTISSTSFTLQPSRSSLSSQLTNSSFTHLFCYSVFIYNLSIAKLPQCLLFVVVITYFHIQSTFLQSPFLSDLNFWLYCTLFLSISFPLYLPYFYISFHILNSHPYITNWVEAHSGSQTFYIFQHSFLITGDVLATTFLSAFVQYISHFFSEF